LKTRTVSRPCTHSLAFELIDKDSVKKGQEFVHNENRETYKESERERKRKEGPINWEGSCRADNQFYQ
jgi:hypothetical protein